ncbi:hypothetical protein [Paraburkholderia atlantica]|uniref:hypothetical protein n=1 Tax=Paraburkholderia atlantica TaxID=2654982 RepID=UPI003D1A1EAC
MATNSKAATRVLHVTEVGQAGMNSVFRRVLADQGAGAHVGLMSDPEVRSAMLALLIRRIGSGSRILSSSIVRAADDAGLNDASARISFMLDGGIEVTVPRGFAGKAGAAKEGSAAKPERTAPKRGSVVYK